MRRTRIPMQPIVAFEQTVMLEPEVKITLNGWRSSNWQSDLSARQEFLLSPHYKS